MRLRSVFGLALGLALTGCAGVGGGLAPLPFATFAAQEQFKFRLFF